MSRRHIPISRRSISIISLSLTGLLLLCSCDYEVPEEITEFLSHCTIDDAYEFTKTVSLSYHTDIKTRVGEELLGEQSITFRADLSDSSDYYSYTIEEFSGDLKVYDQDSSMYVTYTDCLTYYDEESGFFLSKIYKEGYYDEDESSPKDTFQVIEQTDPVLIDDKIDDIFFSTSGTSGYSGGLYYGDFFTYSSRYYMYMSIEDDHLIYDLDDLPYSYDDDEGLMSEMIMMNEAGMVDLITISTDNLTDSKKSTTDLEVTYNEPIERTYDCHYID